MNTNRESKLFELECFVDISNDKYIHPFFKPTHGHLIISGDGTYFVDYILIHMIKDGITRYSVQEMKIVLYSKTKIEDSIPRMRTYIKGPIIQTREDLIQKLITIKKMMMNRFKNFRKFKARDIMTFNAKILCHEIKKRFLPYIWVIIHEMPVIIDQSSDSINSLIYDIVQQSRAAGIHIVLTTTSAKESTSPLFKYQMDGIFPRIKSQDNALVLLEKSKKHLVLDLQNGEVLVNKNVGNYQIYTITLAESRPLLHLIKG